MIGRIILGVLPKQGFISSCRQTLWGHFSRCSFSTAQRTIQVKAFKHIMSKAECEKHNKSIPTYEQFINDPERQKKIAEMFEYYAKDPAHQQEEKEAAALGLELLMRRKQP